MLLAGRILSANSIFLERRLWNLTSGSCRVAGNRLAAGRRPKTCSCTGIASVRTSSNGVIQTFSRERRHSSTARREVAVEAETVGGAATAAATATVVGEDSETAVQPGGTAETVRSSTVPADEGPSTSWYDPNSVNPNLRGHIRNCVKMDGMEATTDRSRDTGASVCFIGTSAGSPTKHRSASATLVRMSGSSYLFDAGEGVQRQLALARTNSAQIRHIFITHMHGDHVLGLPGFLIGLQHMLAESDGNEQVVVRIYGPVGIHNFIAANLILTVSRINKVRIEVYELVGTRVQHLTKRNQKSLVSGRYGEIGHWNIRRYTITPAEGVWTIKDFQPRTRGGILDGLSDRDLRENKRSVRIQAAEVGHVYGVPTFGYIIEEDPPPRNIDAAKAESLGVTPKGRKFDLLKHGFSVFTDDGKNEIVPEQVLLPQSKTSRKIAVVGDNAGWSNSMKEIAEGCDVLVHEATLLEEDANLASRGHSTASMAGKLAGEVNVGVLLLTHISSKTDRAMKEPDLRCVAEEASGGAVKAAVATDFLELLLPWEGFKNYQSVDAADTNSERLTGSDNNCGNKSEDTGDSDSISTGNVS